MRYLCGGAGVDAVLAGHGGQADGGKFSFERDAECGRVCDPTDVGGWARNGNLLVGLFAVDCGAEEMKGAMKFSGTPAGPLKKDGAFGLRHYVGPRFAWMWEL